MKDSAAFLYGKGIFTTIAILDRTPFLWDKHWLRLTDHASRIGLDLSQHSEVSTKRILMNDIESGGVINGRARLTFYDESPGQIWSDGGRVSTGLAVTLADPRPVPVRFKLALSMYPVNSGSPLAGIKSCNYLENLIALAQASEVGCHEAVRLNERGDVTSGVMGNIFWLKGGEMFTPSLRTGCLAGTTREFVIENLDCKQVECGIDAVRNADAIYLTSAGLGVTRVNEFEGRELPDSRHPIEELDPL